MDLIFKEFSYNIVINNVGKLVRKNSIFYEMEI